MTNGFALNHDKRLQIYYFCVKGQVKNNFLKDVESTVIVTSDVIICTGHTIFANTLNL